MQHNVIVITGASAGIGAAFARRAASSGARVALVARRESELNAVRDACGPEALAVVADVSRRVDVERVVADWDEAVRLIDRVAPEHLELALDDAEGAPERALLHLYNCCGESGASLLIVAREAPASWPVALPDLASRLRAAPSVSIALPDDALLASVLVKHFADRQVRVSPGTIAFLVRRMERSFAAAGALAARLDRLALSAGRPIGLALARLALAEAGDQF